MGGEPASAAHNLESCILNMSVEDAWAAIREMDFKWWSKVVQNSQLESKEATSADVGATRNIGYKGCTQKIQITEISDTARQIRWTLVASDPAITYSSRNDRIKVTNVTAPIIKGQVNQDKGNERCFIQWETDFSNDATVQVISDCKYKKHEAFAHLPINKYQRFSRNIDKTAFVF